jgi:hypothetical protein
LTDLTTKSDLNSRDWSVTQVTKLTMTPVQRATLTTMTGLRITDLTTSEGSQCQGSGLAVLSTPPT